MIREITPEASCGARPLQAIWRSRLLTRHLCSVPYYDTFPADRLSFAYFPDLPFWVHPAIILFALTRIAFRKAHEPVGRKDGLVTDQLREIRNVDLVGYGSEASPEESFADRVSKSCLSPLYLAALDYTDASTRAIKVKEETIEKLKVELGRSLEQESTVTRHSEDEQNRKANQQLVEIAATVGAYNLVSRFLVGLNVAEMADEPVPPVEG